MISSSPAPTGNPAAMASLFQAGAQNPLAAPTPPQAAGAQGQSAFGSPTILGQQSASTQQVAGRKTLLGQ